MRVTRRVTMSEPCRTVRLAHRLGWVIGVGRMTGIGSMEGCMRSSGVLSHHVPTSVGCRTTLVSGTYTMSAV